MNVLLALALCAPLMAQTRTTPPEGDEIIDAVSAQALEESSPCAEAPAKGCVYFPSAGAPAGLLVYFRGWWGQYRGHVPASLLATSARTAFREFGFQRLADQRGLAVLVTGSSDVAIAEPDLAALERRLGRRFARLSVGAHSGGYAGLEASLPSLRAIERVIMLDDFYFDREPLTELVSLRVRAGAACTGFVTGHNLERWRTRFKPFVDCPVDVFGDDEHSPAVGRCLGSYLDKTTCL